MDGDSKMDVAVVEDWRQNIVDQTRITRINADTRWRRRTRDAADADTDAASNR
jgi:hypothetical protein